MKTPKDLRYTASHEWVRRESDGTLAVGITDHAQEQLGDIVFVEPPEVGRKVSTGDSVGVVESVKAASDVYSPISGSVIEGNQAIADDPSLVNNDPEGAGWFFKIEVKDSSELDGMMDEGAYRDWIKTL